MDYPEVLFVILYRFWWLFQREYNNIRIVMTIIEGDKNMKKLLTVMIAISMIAVLAGCGNKSENVTESKFESAEDMLAGIYDLYDENDKFPIVGGDSENNNMDEPGEFDITKTEELESMLGFPASMADKIDDAASMIHMMNANTFTCGAYHVINEDDVEELTDMLEENILARQWICGMPDTLIIASAGDGYIVAAFGEAEIMDSFKANITKLGIIVETESPIA